MNRRVWSRRKQKAALHRRMGLQQKLCRLAVVRRRASPIQKPLCYNEVSIDNQGRSTEVFSVYTPRILVAEDYPLRTPPNLWDESTPLPSPRTPVFSPLLYTPLSSAEDRVSDWVAELPDPRLPKRL